MTPQIRTVDIVSGTTVSVLGVCTILYSSLKLDIGTLYDPGTGLFPAGVGALQVFFGMAIVASAFSARDPLPAQDFRAFAAVVASIVIFGLGITRFGLLPSTVGLCMASAFAVPAPNLKKALLIALGVTALAFLIFAKGLGISLSLVAWNI